MPATDAQKAPRTIDVDVEGMTCGSCAARVQRVLGKHRGVVDAEVNYATSNSTRMTWTCRTSGPPSTGSATD